MLTIKLRKIIEIKLKKSEITTYKLYEKNSSQMDKIKELKKAYKQKIHISCFIRPLQNKQTMNPCPVEIRINDFLLLK